MRTTFATLALAALGAANPLPSAVTSSIAPDSSAPAGCEASYASPFEITVVNVTQSAKRGLSKRQTTGTPLMITLTNGEMHDAQGRTGYIAANAQFQFDKPPQAGALFTSGWSVCGNNSIALGGSTIFYQCLSGDFYNLYDKSTGAQCTPVFIEVLGGSSTSSATGSPDSPVTQITDGQPQATTAPVTQISDGQIQATTGAPVTQISDGQIQATTGTTGAPVTQISDGQIQATTGTTGAPVTQISDGQIQATTGTTGAPVTQISDGQIQATTGTTGAPVTQISDGQIQATTGTTGAPVTQISDGQIQATTGTIQATYNAAAPMATGGAFGLAVAMVAVLAL